MDQTPAQAKYSTAPLSVSQMRAKFMFISFVGDVIMFQIKDKRRRQGAMSCDE